MRDKIIEILQKQYDEENPWTTPYHRDTADEIHALQFAEAKNLYFWETNILRFLPAKDIDRLVKFLESYVPQERQSVYARDEYLKATRILAKTEPHFVTDYAWTPIADCTCRHCHPEHWILDRRNIWIRKIGSLGDEVV